MNGNLISSSTFGERLYVLREKAEYSTPRELALVICGYPKLEKGLMGEEAKKVDRMRRNIQNWEQGKNIPNAKMIAILCNLLDCDPDYLLYEDSVYPRKEVKDAADLLNVSTAAIEALLHIGYLDDAFVDEDGNDAELDHFMKPSVIMSALFESDELASLIMDLMHARSFIGLDKNAMRSLEIIDEMDELQQARFERKQAELSGWASSQGYALLQGYAARDLYIQKAADRIKAFEHRLTEYCENEINKDLARRKSARHQNETTNSEQTDSLCWDDFFDSAE